MAPGAYVFCFFLFLLLSAFAPSPFVVALLLSFIMYGFWFLCMVLISLHNLQVVGLFMLFAPVAYVICFLLVVPLLCLFMYCFWLLVVVALSLHFLQVGFFMLAALLAFVFRVLSLFLSATSLFLSATAPPLVGSIQHRLPFFALFVGYGFVLPTAWRWGAA